MDHGHTRRKGIHRAVPRVAAMLVGALLACLPAVGYGAGPSGTAQLDDDQAALDRLTVTVVDLTGTPEGQVYRLWLLSGDGQRALLAGELEPDPTGAARLEWSHPASENLLAPFSRVALTLEPLEASATRPGGVVVIQGEVDRGALGQVRRMLARWPDSRYGSGSLDGLRLLSSLLRFHVAVLQQDAQAGKLDAVHRKAEHVVNLIEGTRGGFFGDHNRDGVVEDPGDGEGLLRYAWGAHTQAQVAWARALDEALADQALDIERPLLFVLDWAGFSRDIALQLAETRDAERARELASSLAIAAERVAAGVDDGEDQTLNRVLQEFGHQSAAARMLRLVRFPLNGVVDEPRTHVVQPGDQLRDIAAFYGVSLPSLVQANDLDNPDLLRVGQVLLIPDPPGAP